MHTLVSVLIIAQRVNFTLQKIMIICNFKIIILVFLILCIETRNLTVTLEFIGTKKLIF